MNKLSVLIIENDLALAMLMEMWLSSFADTVIVSRNYKEAKLELTQQHFDCIFTDIPSVKEAPIDEFYSFCAEQKTGIPTIVMTSCNDLDLLSSIKSMEQIIAVYEKPITPEQLAEAKTLIHG